MADSGSNNSIVTTVLAIEKLLDYLAVGIGAVAGPLLAPWTARQHAKVAIIKAKSKVEIRSIYDTAEAHRDEASRGEMLEARRSWESSKIDSADETFDPDLISEAWRFQQEKRLRNIQTVAEAAAASLGNDEVNAHEPDSDWTARFFSEVQDVSSAGLQQLWARILAGEVRQPGSTSLRTLELLRNMDRNVAIVFQRLCSVTCSLFLEAEMFDASANSLNVVYDHTYDPPNGRRLVDQRVVIFSGHPGKNSLAKYGLGYGVLNVLNEYGLITSDFESWHGYEFCVFERSEIDNPQARLVHGGKDWFLVSSDELPTDYKLDLAGVNLTTSGRELSRVIEIMPNQQYLADLVDYFALQRLQMVEILKL
ncbi:DUF2806 domain-containing protein [Candidatus Poriferisodalis sp.]|uniref:DUF2806 domain-containing protein n=1 Tax=Candidatus Poriferisodalis sp. TaxID=3101277 RepID=UPI003D0CFB4A